MKKNILKKCTSLLIVLIFLISMVTPVYAKNNSINVQLNGENISFDVAPQMVNNRILVPMRTIFEKLGANVDWDEQTEAITATKDGTIIRLDLKSRDALITKNGVASKLQLDTAATVINGRTLVPVRFISESLGKQVGWDEANRTVVIIDYSYFLNDLKSQAPNFYEFANNKYETINTGETNGSMDGSFKYNATVDSGDKVSDNVNAKINAKFNAKLNPENGSMDATINITGLQDVLKDSGLENVDNVNFNLLFDNNSFYVKSNLSSLLTKTNVGEKWIKADIADLGIPDVKTFQDLKNMQKELSSEQIFDPLTSIPMDLDVNSFKEAQSLFNTFVTLVDNNHFTVTDNGEMKVYKWNIKKQDLVDVVLNIEKNSGSFEDMSLKDLAEMKKFADSLVFDLNMEVGVKNNTILSSKTSLNAQMDIPDTGRLELSLNTSQITNPTSAAFDITMPNSSNVINFKDLVADNSVLPEDIY